MNKMGIYEVAVNAIHLSAVAHNMTFVSRTSFLPSSATSYQRHVARRNARSSCTPLSLQRDRALKPDAKHSLRSALPQLHTICLLCRHMEALLPGLQARSLALSMAAAYSVLHAAYHCIPCHLYPVNVNQQHDVLPGCGYWNTFQKGRQ